MSLATRVAALATRMGNEFRGRFGAVALDADVLYGAANFQPSSLQALRVGQLVTINARYDSPITPGSGARLFTLREEFRPVGTTSGVAFSDANEPTRMVSALASGYVVAPGSGSIKELTITLISP